MPVVRVGIVSWNTAECLGACLDALPAALDGIDAEIVLVDNASTDESAQVAASRPFVRVVRNGRNVGYARAMNQALGGTDAEFLLAVNPDTVCPPGSLRALADYLQEHPDVGLVAPRLLNADGSLQHSVHRFPSFRATTVMGFVPPPLRSGWIGEQWWLEGSADAEHERVVDIDWVIGAVHCIRASAIEGELPYNERWFMYGEDMDRCWKLHGRGWRVVLLGTVPVMHIGNVAGEKAWGAAREARWLDSMYDWYVTEHGVPAAQAYAFATSIGLVTKLAVAAGLVRSHRPGAEALRGKIESQRALVRLHFQRIAASRLRPSTARPVRHLRASPRLLAIAGSGWYAGAEMVLLRDLDAARAAGWSVRVACAPGPLVDQLSRLNIPYTRFPQLKPRGGNRAVSLVGVFFRGLAGALRLRTLARDADVVLVNGVNALLPLRLARLRVPSIYYVHDVVVRGDRLAMLRFGAPAIDLAIAVSEAAAQPVRDAGAPAAVVRNGTAWPVAPAPVVAPSPPVVGCAGVLTPLKGQDLLLEAVARLTRDDVVVELIGGTLPSDAAFEAKLRRRAAEPDLAGRVRFLGYVPQPLDRMRTWSIGVSASIEPESGPMTALEAMSIGLPFVATRHGGVVEVLHDAGLLVSPGDADGLAHALDRLLDDEELRRRCHEAGPRLFLEQHLTMADHQRHVLALLDRVLGVSGCRRTPDLPAPAAVADDEVESA
jgi:GT2 family glycosyltransferase/glycosyltransferase involved in cell wall biosynthesis